MANKGVKRGIGLQNGLPATTNIWGGITPINSSLSGTFTGIQPFPYYFNIKGPATNQSKRGLAMVIDDNRIIQGSVTSQSNLSNNSASLLVNMNPLFSSNGVTDYSQNAITASGNVGLGSESQGGMSSTGKYSAFSAQMFTYAGAFGVYGLTLSLGSVLANVTEAVGIDNIQIAGGFGIITNGIFLRNQDSAMGLNIINPWNMQMSYAPSQHRGPFGIGGLAITNLPGVGPQTGQSASPVLDVINTSIAAIGVTYTPDVIAYTSMPGTTVASINPITTTAGSQTVTSSAAFGSVVVGQYVMGTGILPGTTVVAKNSSSSLLLSLPTQLTTTVASMIFSTLASFTVASTLASSTTVTSAALFGSVAVGMLVTGVGLQTGTIVTAVGSTSSITINFAATVSASSTLTFYINSPIRTGKQMNWAQTTTTGAIAIWADPTMANVVKHVKARIWARRTGGASGSSDDSVAFNGEFMVSNRALVGSPMGAGALAPLTMGTYPATFTAASTTTLNSQTVTSAATFGSVSVGQAVTGVGIATGSWVIAKATSSSITISNPATAAGTPTLSFCPYFVSVSASAYGTAINVNGPATTNVTWQAEIDGSGWLSI